MCWRHESRNGFSAWGYAEPTALLSATEFASRAATAAVTAGSLRLPFFAIAVPVAMPASCTCSSRRYVSPARSSAAFVVGAAVPVTASGVMAEEDVDGALLAPSALLAV